MLDEETSTDEEGELGGWLPIWPFYELWPEHTLADVNMYFLVGWMMCILLGRKNEYGEKTSRNSRGGYFWRETRSWNPDGKKFDNRIEIC